MLVFRRVNVSDMRYYIKQLLSKSAERKAVRSPRKEARGSVSSQNVSITEGVRAKDRKRKLDAVIVEDDTGQKVSLFKAIFSRSYVRVEF